MIAAQADDAAPRAQAAQQGGVQITPARVESTAKKGTVASFTVKNSTKDTLRVTVTIRPWSQNRATGQVAINKRANLSPYVVASPQVFDLRPGTRSLKLNMKRTTASGSLYGGIQVFAKQKKKKATNGIIPQYEVIGALRLNPRVKRPNLRVGATDVVGRGNGRSLILAVRNTGNTLDPVSGTVKITGPTGRTSTIPAVSIVPGQVVYLRGGSLRGMKGGNYTATWSITQGTKRYTAKRTFKL